jgi:cysteine desulfurase
MGALTHGNVRVSLGRESAEGEVRRLASVLPDVVDRLRAASGVPPEVDR